MALSPCKHTTRPAKLSSGQKQRALLTGFLTACAVTRHTDHQSGQAHQRKTTRIRQKVRTLVWAILHIGTDTVQTKQHTRETSQGSQADRKRQLWCESVLLGCLCCHCAKTTGPWGGLALQTRKQQEEKFCMMASWLLAGSSHKVETPPPCTGATEQTRRGKNTERNLV